VSNLPPWAAKLLTNVTNSSTTAKLLDFYEVSDGRQRAPCLMTSSAEPSTTRIFPSTAPS